LEEDQESGVFVNVAPGNREGIGNAVRAEIKNVP
jgi:hypothetical protein